MQKVLVFGITILGVVGAILNALGYAATMTILLGATGLTLLWTQARLGSPPAHNERRRLPARRLMNRPIEA